MISKGFEERFFLVVGSYKHSGFFLQLVLGIVVDLNGFQSSGFILKAAKDNNKVVSSSSNANEHSYSPVNTHSPYDDDIKSD